MCKLLNISRKMIYYTYQTQEADTEVENEVIKIFNANRKVYGTRKIKNQLKSSVSRKKIGLIMEKYNLISKYTLKRYKRHKTTVNNSDVSNILDRDFNRTESLDVLVSDLTYVRVGERWNYICTIIDLFNREIIGYSCGKTKSANLVIEAFNSINRPLDKVNIFHTDRGSEFKNQAIDHLINEHKITRSLSDKGVPYDNAVAESTYNIIKTEFVFGEKFDSLEQLNLEFFDYVNWYNHHRIHGSLGYLSPYAFRKLNHHP